MNCGNMCQNHGNVKEKVPVHGITQGHQISRQDAGNDGRFQASLHENQGLVRGKVPCEGIALKRGVPCDGGGGVGAANVGFAMTFPDTMWRGNASYSGCVCTRNRQPETKSVGSWEAAILKRAAFQGR